MQLTDSKRSDSVRKTLDYNSEFYATYYRNPFLKYRYDLLYRAKRVADIFDRAGVDFGVPGFRAFEYGFGAGHLLQVASSASAVVGMESSSAAVSNARTERPNNHPHWEMIEWADATQIPLDSESFDLVTASHVLEHLPDDDTVLDEFIRLIRPGGYLLIILPNNEVLFKGSKHLRVYDVEAFSKRLVKLGLEPVKVDRHQRFDRPFKHRFLVLASRKNVLIKTLVDACKILLFLPPQTISWRLLAGLDSALGLFGAKSSSVAYLYQKA